MLLDIFDSDKALSVLLKFVISSNTFILFLEVNFYLRKIIKLYNKKAILFQIIFFDNVERYILWHMPK